MPFRPILSLCLAVCTLSTLLFGQESSKSASVQDVDLSAFLKETQQSANEPGYAGLVWWIPTQYWEIAAERSGVSEEKAKQRYGALKKYTVVAVALGKIGIGNINWVSEPDIRDNVVLRDSDGNPYPPVQKLSGDAAGLASVLKPVFGNILGTMGQNIQLLSSPLPTRWRNRLLIPWPQEVLRLCFQRLWMAKTRFSNGNCH